MNKADYIKKATDLGLSLTGKETVAILKEMIAKNSPAENAGGDVATDTRGHEVKKYQDASGNWFVERNNNGCVHPEPCADEAAATALFTQYVEGE